MNNRKYVSTKVFKRKRQYTIQRIKERNEKHILKINEEELVNMIK